MSAPRRVKFHQNEFVVFDDIGKVFVAQDEHVVIDGDAILDLQSSRLFIGKSATQKSNVKTK